MITLPTPRHWRRGALVALLVAGLAVPLFVFSLNDASIFELEGNAAHEGAVGDDWENIADDRPGGPGTNSQNNSIASNFITDGIGATDVGFAGGGSKDVRDVNLWQHTSGPVSPGKNEIGHAFAAAYTDPGNGHLLIYFGLDRSGAGGDAATGFWFFKNNISIGPDGKFNGVHSVGDILITSDYVTGGKIGEVNVYKWVGGSKPLEVVGAAAAGSGVTVGDRFCLNNATGQTTPLACGASNSGATPVPTAWSTYLFSAGGGFEPRTQFPERTFFEGAIDMTQVFGEGTTPCFSSFMAMTRTSASPSAQLKDFALGQFSLCDMAVAKACQIEENVSPALNANGTTINTKFRVRISNPGVGALHDVQLLETVALGGTSGNSCSVTAVDIPSGSGTAAVPALTLPYALTKDGAVEVAQTIAAKKYIDATITCESTSNPFLNAVEARAKSSSSQATPDLVRTYAIEKDSGDDCPLQINPLLAVKKSCLSKPVALVLTSSGMLAKACYQIEISNTGTVALLDLEALDPRLTGNTTPQTPLALPRTTLGPQGSLTDSITLGGDTDKSGTIEADEELCFQAKGPDDAETDPTKAAFENLVSVTAVPALLNPDIDPADQLVSGTSTDTCYLCK